MTLPRSSRARFSASRHRSSATRTLARRPFRSRSFSEPSPPATKACHGERSRDLAKLRFSPIPPGSAAAAARASALRRRSAAASPSAATTRRRGRRRTIPVVAARRRRGRSVTRRRRRRSLAVRRRRWATVTTVGRRVGSPASLAGVSALGRRGRGRRRRRRIALVAAVSRRERRTRRRRRQLAVRVALRGRRRRRRTSLALTGEGRLGRLPLGQRARCREAGAQREQCGNQREPGRAAIRAVCHSLSPAPDRTSAAIPCHAVLRSATSQPRSSFLRLPEGRAPLVRTAARRLGGQHGTPPRARRTRTPPARSRVRAWHRPRA